MDRAVQSPGGSRPGSGSDRVDSASTRLGASAIARAPTDQGAGEAPPLQAQLAARLHPEDRHCARGSPGHEPHGIVGSYLGWKARNASRIANQNAVRQTPDAGVVGHSQQKGSSHA